MSARPVLLLLGVVVAVYWPVLLGGFVYDDQSLVVRNAALQTHDLAALLSQPLFGPDHGYWRPLTSLCLWFGNTLGGAHGIHALALLLHLLATLLLLRLGQLLLGEARTAWAAALLFALHPAQVEGVAWCAAINEPLWVLCGLACLHAAWRGRAAATAAWCLAALLAKENALALLPLALAARALGEGPRRPTAVAPLAVALLAVALLWWCLRALVFGELAAGLLRAPSDPVVAAHPGTAALELFGRELGLLVLPWPLSPFRALTGNGAAIARAATWTACWLGALLFAWRRAHRRAALLLLVIGLPLLLAALRADRLGAYPVADRYLCLPVAGFALLLATVLPARVRTCALLALALVAAPLSFVQTWNWQDDGRLAQHGIAVQPDDANLCVMAGNHALGRGDTAAAKQQFEAAQRLLPQSTSGVAHRAASEAWLGLGWCALQQARPDAQQAIVAFGRVLAAAPESSPAHVGLGVAHGMIGDAATAERELRRAIELDAGNSEAHCNLGFLWQQRGQRDRARDEYELALRCNPGNEVARQRLQQLH